MKRLHLAKGDAKKLVEAFCKLKNYKVRFVKEPESFRTHCGFFIRIRYGKYSLKYFDTKPQPTQEAAWLIALIEIAHDIH